MVAVDAGGFRKVRQNFGHVSEADREAFDQRYRMGPRPLAEDGSHQWAVEGNIGCSIVDFHLRIQASVEGEDMHLGDSEETPMHSAVQVYNNDLVPDTHLLVDSHKGWLKQGAFRNEPLQSGTSRTRATPHNLFAL